MSTFFAFPTPLDGKDAYQQAVEDGFVGSLSEWLASLVGPAGKGAYQQAVDNGFVGDLTAWLASLVGPAGATGPAGPTGEFSSLDIPWDLAPLTGSVITSNNCSYAKSGKWILLNGSFTFSESTGQIRLPHPCKYGFAMPIGPYSGGMANPTMLVATQDSSTATFTGSSSGTLRYLSVVYITTTGGIGV